MASLLRFVRVVAALIGSATIIQAESRISRLPQNPLITIESSVSLGDNVNGPTVIRVPDWIPRPLGRYYLYFAHHKGQFIRLAYADAITGPWKIYEPGVLPMRDTAFYRPQPDPPGFQLQFYTHVASPEILIDASHKRLILWVHGWWTNGEAWPLHLQQTREWITEKRYGQYTQAFESDDGVHFQAHPSITRASYLRVFPFDRRFYAMARLGQLLRSDDPFGAFEVGPNPFRATPYANRVRHVALINRGSQLVVFFTAIGDAPERLLMSTINLTGDWSEWKASTSVELLTPQARYECSELPNVPSAPGEIEGPARQIRDPAIFQENGRTFLFYTICGEQGVAAAEFKP